MADRLPSELMTEILTRLPVKTLVQIRCVCKAWCSLISSPNFISSKVNQTIHFNKINNSDTLLISHYINKRRKGGGRFSANFYDERLGGRLIQLESPIPNSASHFHIFDSCNGLVCLTDNAFDKANNLILWNPSIRKSVRLPIPSIGIDSHTNTVVRAAGSDGPYGVVIGYGFDFKTNDYKVVRITCINNFPFPEVELYSLNRGHWRRICVAGPIHHFCFAPRPSQAFVNGIVHWVGCNMVAASDISILTFDMSSEVFSQMKLPTSPENGWVVSHLAVSVLRESLCVGHFDSLVRKVSIWVMKEYGVVESWTKLFTFDLGRDFGGILGFRRNGDLLFFKRYDHLFSMDLESQQVKDLRIRLSRDDLKSLYVVTYMESLVLL
ncbi:F-box protein CPR1-like [Cornus florida]|uniref:F-box protein CPR1-like n=1 Tax=Cornus florida TaxID=4283 RepID=UPI002897F981|nr:F-box protein CPR1-like [Cornus florida]XP_059644179.1 F-box protein CPR1-like [Cornus florida]